MAVINPMVVDIPVTLTLSLDDARVNKGSAIEAILVIVLIPPAEFGPLLGL